MFRVGGSKQDRDDSLMTAECLCRVQKADGFPARMTFRAMQSILVKKRRKRDVVASWTTYGRLEECDDCVYFNPLP